MRYVCEMGLFCLLGKIYQLTIWAYFVIAVAVPWCCQLAFGEISVGLIIYLLIPVVVLCCCQLACGKISVGQWLVAIYSQSEDLILLAIYNQSED